MDLSPKLIWGGWVDPVSGLFHATRTGAMWPVGQIQPRGTPFFFIFIFCWVLAMKVYTIEINFKHPYFYFLSKNKSEGMATRGLLSAAIEVLQPPSDRVSAL